MSKLKLGLLQVGRSPTANLNFHIRNLLDGLLRITRGFPEAPIADVVRVNADNSLEFPGGIKGGFAKEYVSPEQAFVASSLVTLAHGLGAAPKLFQGVLTCKTADAGYAVGDTLVIPLSIESSSAADSFNCQVRFDAVNIYVRFGINSFLIGRGTDGASVQSTAANWRLIVRAWVYRDWETDRKSVV